MGSIGGMLGLGGGAAGTGFAAPQAANITDPVTGQQISTAYNNTQNSMQSQQQLLAALQAQNALQNQSQVYNQLQGIAAGTGPNPAQAMLNQATGQNVANQAALMAGQRGAGSNVGLIARQAAQQGAATQQQAVGQGASMQAQQALNAINAAGGMANTQASNLVGQTNANVSAQQAEQQALLNAQAAYNQAQVASQASMNQANAALAQQQMQGGQNLLGGVMNMLGPASGVAKAEGGYIERDMAAGGIVRGYADGGDTAFSNPTGPQSKFGQFLVNSTPSSNYGDSSVPVLQNNNDALKKGATAAGNKLLNTIKGALSSPSQAAPASTGPGQPPSLGTNILAGVSTPDQLEADIGRAQGGMIHDYRTGGNVNAHNPKEKAVEAGNSYANDKIPAMLSEGEVVVPRNVMQSADPVGNAAKFVESILAKRGMRK